MNQATEKNIIKNILELDNDLEQVQLLDLLETIN